MRNKINYVKYYGTEGVLVAKKTLLSMSYKNMKINFIFLEVYEIFCFLFLKCLVLAKQAIEE